MDPFKTYNQLLPRKRNGHQLNALSKNSSWVWINNIISLEWVAFKRDLVACCDLLIFLVDWKGHENVIFVSFSTILPRVELDLFQVLECSVLLFLYRCRHGVFHYWIPEEGKIWKNIQNYIQLSLRSFHWWFSSVNISTRTSVFAHINHNHR